MIITTKPAWIPIQSLRQNDRFFFPGGVFAPPFAPSIRLGWGSVAVVAAAVSGFFSGFASTIWAREERGSMRLATSAYTTTRRFLR